ncbi:MAG TPA: hypothetical protein VGG01_05020 [Xanthobacteraceae bacterium]|jgi:hypothetical protein
MRLHQVRSCLAALLFAGLTVAAAFLVGSRSFQLVPYVIVVALAHAVILGLPLFLLLNAWGRIGIAPSIVGGFAIGCLPVGLLTFPAWLNESFNAWSGGAQTVVNGVTTVAGWLEYLQFIGIFGSLGAIAGATFFATLRVTRDFSNVAGPHAGGPRSLMANGLLFLSVLLTAGAFALPAITSDRTCHNMFRNGRQSVRSRVNVVLEISADDWLRLTKLFEEFATAHELSFRNNSRSPSDVVQVLNLSLCNDSGLNIEALQQLWHQVKSVPANGVTIGIYVLRNGSQWRGIAHDLAARLESTWPGKIKFKDGNGRIVPAPTNLQAPD